MIVSFEQMLEKAKQGEPMVLAGAAAQDVDTIKAMAAAEEAGMIRPVLVGDIPTIERVMKEEGVTFRNAELVQADDMVEACAKAVELVRLTGLKDVRRVGQAHNLNMRAAAMKVCREKGVDYYSSNVAVAHLGGGITLSLHSNGRIIDIVSDDEGPFSPERAGLIPDYLMVRKIEKDKLDYNGTMKLLQRQGGLTSYFGTSDSRVVEKMAEEGDHDAHLVYEAMALGVARGLARLAVLVKGKVDYFVLTGGIAYSKSFCEMVKDYAGFLGEFVVVPGENEMQALADGCLRVLGGEETAHIYG